MGDPVIDVLRDEWDALDEVCRDLDEQQWKTPTALPGWTVQDCISHVIGIERSMMGDPPPNVETEHLAHVNDEMAAMLETWVEARRPLSGDEVLHELRDQTARRIEQLRSLTDEQLDEVGWSPIGEVPYRMFLRVRV